MDTEDYTAKDIYTKIMAIRKRALEQIIDRIDNPNEKERIKKELFTQFSDGEF
jgi:hypothetical protein